MSQRVGVKRERKGKSVNRLEAHPKREAVCGRSDGCCRVLMRGFRVFYTIMQRLLYFYAKTVLSASF